MAINYPGPVEIRLFYQQSGLQHEQRLNCNSPTELFVGMDASAVSLYDRLGIGGDAVTLVTAWVNLIKTQFASATMTFDYFEIWEYDEETHVAQFISTATLGIAGGSGSSYQDSHQDIYSFRTQEGNQMFIHLMETIVATQTRLGYSALNANQQAIVDFLLSDDDWILARDTSYPAAFAAYYGGQNEAVFKRRHR